MDEVAPHYVKGTCVLMVDTEVVTVFRMITVSTTTLEAGSHHSPQSDPVELHIAAS